MAQVSIYGRGLTPKELKALAALLDKTGVCDKNVEVVESIDEQTDGPDESFVIFLGVPATCADEALEENLICAHSSGQSAIWVWPAECDDAELPAVAKKYCYSIISWDPQKLKAAIAEDQPCFEYPQGIPLPPPKTERNICVDETE